MLINWTCVVRELFIFDLSSAVSIRIAVYLCTDHDLNKIENVFRVRVANK